MNLTGLFVTAKLSLLLLQIVDEKHPQDLQKRVQFYIPLKGQ